MRLKMAIQKAKDVNMPNDKHHRAIQRGAGDSDGANFEEVVYERLRAGGICPPAEYH
jgi:transcriptional/translational regulatory protein YebC/TACO1